MVHLFILRSNFGEVEPEGVFGGEEEGCGVRLGGDHRAAGPTYFFIPLVLGPLNSLLWYVPS